MSAVRDGHTSHNNPFVHELRLTMAQKVQVFFMSITFAPIKLVLFSVGLVLTWALALLVTLGDHGLREHSVGWVRRNLYQLFRLLGRLDLFLMGIYHINVKGKRASSTEAPIMLAVPHSAILDILLWFVSSPMPTAISKWENSETPLLGTLLKAIQPILVNRDDRQSRRNSVQLLKRRMSSPSAWPQLIVFPEGTCTNAKSLIQFKAGAFLPGVPIQPVVIRYLNSMNSFTWTEIGPGGFTLMWLTLCQFSIQVEVEFLPVYKPDLEEQEDAVMYANNVQKYLCYYLDMPCSDHSIEDWQLMRYASKFTFPREKATIGFHDIHEKFNVNYNDVKARLSEFAVMAKKKGVLSVENFAGLLNVSLSPSVQHLFHLYDTERCSFITFKQYVVGFYSISLPSVTENWEISFDNIKKHCLLLPNNNSPSLESAIKEKLSSIDITDISSIYSVMCERPELVKLLEITQNRN